MPWIDISITATVLVTLVVGLLTRRGSPKPVICAGALTVVALLFGAAMEGARPQIIASGVLAVLCSMVVLWARSARAFRLAVTSAVVLSLLCVGTAGASWALPPVYVEAGTGSYAVAVDSQVWVDAGRDARGGDGPGERRSLPVSIWYPTDASGEPAPYLPQRDHAAELTDALADQYGLPAIVFDSLERAKGQALWRGHPAEGRFPVVIASPGLGSTRWFFTSWAQEIASHGVVVIALDHPYDAAATELADGTVAFSELQATGDDARDQAIADAGARIRAADIRAVIDRMETETDKASVVRSADLAHIIAAGHSMGGAAAIEAARLDSRITGVIDIDGMPRSPEGTVLTVPLVVVVAGDADANPGYDAAVDELLAGGDAARVTFDGITHFSLIDVALMIAPVPGITGARGPSGPSLVAESTLVLIDAATTGRGLDTDALARIGRTDAASGPSVER